MFDRNDFSPIISLNTAAMELFKFKTRKVGNHSMKHEETNLAACVAASLPLAGQTLYEQKIVFGNKNSPFKGRIRG